MLKIFVRGTFIGWSDNKLNKLHPPISLEITKITACAAEESLMCSATRARGHGERPVASTRPEGAGEVAAEEGEVVLLLHSAEWCSHHTSSALPKG